MNTTNKKVRGFVVGDNCYFYDYDFNFLFWKAAKLVNFNKKVLNEEGIYYDADFYSKTRIKEEYMKSDGSTFEPVLMFTKEGIASTTLMLGNVQLSNNKKLEFKKADVRFGAKISEANKLSFFFGVLLLVNKFFDSEFDVTDEKATNIGALELNFSKNIVDSGICDLFPAARTQMVDLANDHSEVSWFFHKKFAFFAECHGVLKEDKLFLKA